MRFVQAVFPLPALSVILILMLRRRPLEREAVAAMGLYALYLLPYIIVSYTDRYGAALVGIKMLLVVYGIDTVLQHLPWSRASRTVLPDA